MPEIEKHLSTRVKVTVKEILQHYLDHLYEDGQIEHEIDKFSVSMEEGSLKLEDTLVILVDGSE